MKVQKAISIDTDVLAVLMGECKREEITFSDYVMEAINRIGPLTYELASQIRPKNSMGMRREEFFDARKPTAEVPSDEQSVEIPPSLPRKAY